MKRRILSILLAILLCVGTVMSVPVFSYAYTSQVATVKASSVNVRSGPGTSNSKITTLTMGTQVVVNDEITASDGTVWCSITYDNGTKPGYIAKQYLGMSTVYEGLSDADFENLLNAQGFPDSYKQYLRALHAEYPNWTFKAVKTGLDWETAVKEESAVGRNLVSTTAKSSWKSIADGAYDWNTSTWPGFDSSAWVAASEDIIRYYMDPRNFLDATYVFQFLDQTYNASLHTSAGLESMIKGTFLESSVTGALGYVTSNTTTSAGSTVVTDDGSALVGGSFQAVYEKALTYKSSSMTQPGGSSGSKGSSTPGTSPGSSPGGNGSATYADMIMYAAQQSGVNPYVLASMIIQEQGKSGTSDLISGNNRSYPGIYNFYNVEAYQSGSMTAIERGLWWASQSGSYDRPWNSRQTAIVGGAKFYGENYTKAKQNTFYLKKFNVIGSNLYKHQFMSNIQAAALEGYHLAQAYTSEVKNAAHEFEIPVYNNMPATPAACPSLDGSPNNKLGGLAVEGFSLTPTFDRDVNAYDLIVDNSVSMINVSAIALDSKATVYGTGNIALEGASTTITVNVKAQNGSNREYKINVVKKAGGPTYVSGTGTLVTITGGGTPGTATPGSNTSTSSGSSSPASTSGSSSPTSGSNNVILKGPGQ